MEEPKRIDRVLVAAGGRRFEITWNEREDLLERVRRIRKSTGVITVFRNIGTSNVVELDPRGREIVLAALDAWEHEAGPLPDGAAQLREGLREIGEQRP